MSNPAPRTNESIDDFINRLREDGYKHSYKRKDGTFNNDYSRIMNNRDNAVVRQFLDERGIQIRSKKQNETLDQFLGRLRADGYTHRRYVNEKDNTDYQRIMKNQNDPDVMQFLHDVGIRVRDYHPKSEIETMPTKYTTAAKKAWETRRKQGWVHPAKRSNQSIETTMTKAQIRSQAARKAHQTRKKNGWIHPAKRNKTTLTPQPTPTIPNFEYRSINISPEAFNALLDGSKRHIIYMTRPQFTIGETINILAPSEGHSVSGRCMVRTILEIVMPQNNIIAAGWCVIFLSE